MAPILVVDKEGWAKEAGLDLKFTTFESGPLMIQALASGTIDIYVAGVAPLGLQPKRRTACIVDPSPFDVADWPMIWH